MNFQCILEDKYCNECGQCNICDIDSTKICNNCCKCIDNDSDYNSISIDEIIEDEANSFDINELRD